MYWGLRVLEAFPQAKTLQEAIGEALKPPKKDAAGQAVVVAGAGGVLTKGGSTFIGGPAPPFIVQEKGSSINKKAGFKWKWGNKDVLFKSGKVSDRSGKPFKRGSAPSKSGTNKIRIVIGKVDTAIDGKVTGQARGGMTWFDASKQIIPPYAPPPLKPPLPNTKKFKF